METKYTRSDLEYIYKCGLEAGRHKLLSEKGELVGYDGDPINYRVRSLEEYFPLPEGSFPQWKKEDVWIYHEGITKHISHSCISPGDEMDVILFDSVGEILLMIYETWRDIQKYSSPLGPLEKEIKYHQQTIERLQKEFVRLKPIWDKTKK